MNTRKPKALFWSIYIDAILCGKKPPVALGGADVQLAFWAKSFSDKGWESYSFHYQWTGFRMEHEGIHFLFAPLVRKVMFLLRYLKYIWVMVIRPDVVVVRTGGDDVYLLKVLSRLLKYKLVYMVASDTEFLPCRPEDLGRRQKQVLALSLIVAQNAFQRDCIQSVRGSETEIPVIPNIWVPGLLDLQKDVGDNRYSVVWIGNIREIKRPEWVTDLARDLPDLSFAIVGSLLEPRRFRRVMDDVNCLENLAYLGGRSFQEVNRILSKSKLLICTSVMEGFPNTFLQAWNLGIPVVSTVNPNGVLTKYHIGLYVPTYGELLKGVSELISDQGAYTKIQGNITGYLKSMHDPQKHYEVLVRFLKKHVTTLHGSG